MKRPILFSSVLCLVIGLLCGLILPAPWDQSNLPRSVQTAPLNSSASTQTGPVSDTDPAALKASIISLDINDNSTLLTTALFTLSALKSHDYDSLASLADPMKGITFTPYSTVNPETDRTLTASQLKGAAKDETVYTWGSVDGRGSLIELTIPQYLDEYVFNMDYTQAPKIGIDEVLMSGNALENVAEAYPNGRFVDFSFPSADSDRMGLDWYSLKLVFEPGPISWNLVGVIHGQWTI